MIATRPTTAFSPIEANFDKKPGLRSLQEIFHDQRQWRSSRGSPSSPVERTGAIHQGSVVRKSECPFFARAATTAASDQYPDQCRRQQYRRERIRSDPFGRRQV